MYSKEELIQHLQTLHPEFEPKLIEKMADFGVIKQFKEGDIILNTGKNIRNTMLLLDGLVKIYRGDEEEGGEYFMYHLQAGQACAISMICATTRATSQLTAKVIEDSYVLLLPLQYMDEWMREHRSWYHFVLETYRSRFEEMLVVIDHIAFRNMDERLEFYLKRHQDTLDTNIIRTTHQQIADELNSSREVITRLMKKLAERGKIIIHRNYIEIVKL